MRQVTDLVRQHPGQLAHAQAPDQPGGERDGALLARADGEGVGALAGLDPERGGARQARALGQDARELLQLEQLPGSEWTCLDQAQHQTGREARSQQPQAEGQADRDEGAQLPRQAPGQEAEREGEGGDQERGVEQVAQLVAYEGILVHEACLRPCESCIR